MSNINDLFEDSKIPISDVIKERLVKDNKRFFSNDNIAEYLNEGELELLIEEASGKFEGVLDSFLIDWKNDPNAKGTPKRLAKMFLNEIFEGRYQRPPNVASFPNDESSGSSKYRGMLTAFCELKSTCSHHWQPVDLECYIGVIPTDHMIGLSKYTRLARFCARRGTLQEELTNDIAKAIMEAAKTEDVAVYLKGEHGCCQNRGISVHDSSTFTMVLHGQFWKAEVKEEFLTYISHHKFRCK